MNKAYENGDQGTLALKLSAAPGTGKTNVVSVSLRIQNPLDFLRISSGSEKSLYHFKYEPVLDRIVGEYVQKGGRGRIGQKPIQIAKTGNRFVLFELREIEAEPEMAKAA